MKWLIAANKNIRSRSGKKNMQKSQIYSILLRNLHSGQGRFKVSTKLNVTPKRRESVCSQNLSPRGALGSCPAAQADGRSWLFWTLHCRARRWIGFQKQTCSIYHAELSRWVTFDRSESSFGVSMQKWQHEPDKWFVGHCCSYGSS